MWLEEPVNTVSTHILDAAASVPAVGVTVTLALDGTPLASGVTGERPDRSVR